MSLSISFTLVFKRLLMPLSIFLIQIYNIFKKGLCSGEAFVSVPFCKFSSINIFVYLFMTGLCVGGRDQCNGGMQTEWGQVETWLYMLHGIGICMHIHIWYMVLVYVCIYMVYGIVICMNIYGVWYWYIYVYIWCMVLVYMWYNGIW